MSANAKRTVTPDQVKQAAEDLNLTIATIADGAGLSKAYISEFRSKKRNLTQPEQARLRGFLEVQYEDQGQAFPEGEDTSGQDLLQGLGGMVKQITRPAILLSENVPAAQAEKLLDLIDTNRLKVADLLTSEFQAGGLFGGDFSEETESAIREIFALLALNYVAILMLQGRNIARKVPDGAKPKTLGDWLSGYLSSSPLASLLPVVAKAKPEAEEA